jgi:hypothetical protein
MSERPRAVPADLRWRLLTNTSVLLGSFFFALGIIGFIAIVPRTALLSRWRLSHDRQEAPGWLSASRQTDHTEHDISIYRYDYSFMLPNESMQSGSSYANDALHKKFTPRTLANPGRVEDFTVEYYPADPRISRIKGTNVYFYSASLLWEVMVPILGLLMTLGGLAHGRGKIRLLREGVLAEATIRSARQVELDGGDPHRSLKVGNGPFSLWFGDLLEKLEKVIPDVPVAQQGGPGWRRPFLTHSLRFVLAALTFIGGLAGSLGNYLSGTRFWTKPNALDAARDNAWRWWRDFGWFVALLSALICLGILVVPITSDFGRRLLEIFRRREELEKGGSVEAFREVQIAEERIINRVDPVLPALLLAVGAGIIAFTATGFFMALPDSMQGQKWHGGWPAGLVSAVAAATIFVLVARWMRRRPPPEVDRLERAKPTAVECTYEFPLPDGRLATGKDRFPLPAGPDDIRARRVIYDPARPENSERLFGFFPPVRPSPTGQWEYALDESPVLRVILVVAAYTVAPLIGWLST